MHSLRKHIPEPAIDPMTAPESFLPLRPVEFDILLSLAGGDRHGYGVIQETEERTGGRVRLELGTLYRALRRMEEQELIAPTDPPPGEEDADGRRRYYALTPLGRAVAAAETRRMEGLVAVARRRDLAGEPEGA